MITYYVSGAPDVQNSLANLIATGRNVIDGNGLADAVAALTPGQRFVLVAHGETDGRVYIREAEDPWLWVGMDPSPAGARIYLYSCCAGPLLSEYLGGCECIGHATSVPMPDGTDADIVIQYLDFIDELMSGAIFDRNDWYEQIALYLGERLSDEVEAPTTLRAPILLSMLGRSIGMQL